MISSFKFPTSAAIAGSPKLYPRKSTPLWKHVRVGQNQNIGRFEVQFRFFVRDVFNLLNDSIRDAAACNTPVGSGSSSVADPLAFPR